MSTTKRLNSGDDIIIDMNSYEISIINNEIWLKART